MEEHEEEEEEEDIFETPPCRSGGVFGNHAREISLRGLKLQDGGESPLPPLPISASVQDLRSLDVKKAIQDAINDVVQESPRGVLDNDSRCLESETGSLKTSTSFSGSRALRRVPTQWKSLFRMWKQKSLRRLPTFSTVTTSKFSRGRIARDAGIPQPHAGLDSEFSFFKPSWKSFSISELQVATNDFHPDNIIGKGGYAEVFRGCLADGQLVAIKRLTRGTSEEKIIDFLSELGIIVHIDHPNTARLIGFGIEGGMHLILKLSPNGSLASRLHESEEHLKWSTRYNIATGIAQGLEYLHEKCPRRIIHRDIKAANILLTEDFEAQICDFGLAKWLPDQWSHHTVPTFAGTFGYLAPEYISHGIVDEKTDVFAFGVLLLELITGRRALNSSRQSLVIWAAPLLEKNDIKNLVDPFLADAYDHAQMNHALSAASQCIRHSASLRPKMSEVLKVLRGEDGLRNLRGKALRRTFSVEIFDAEEYNATKYLNDLRCHRQVALEP